MAKQKSNGPAKVELSLGKAVDLFPDSLAKAFKIKGKGNHLYFMVDEKAREVKNKSIKFTFRAYKFYPGQGIILTNLTVKLEDDVIPIPMSEFGEAVNLRIKELQLIGDTESLDELDYYAELGFNTHIE